MSSWIPDGKKATLTGKNGITAIRWMQQSLKAQIYADVATPERLLLQMLDQQHIAELLEELPEVQRRRLLLYAEGKSLREIARMECVDHKAVKKSIEAAKKYFLKNF